MSRRVLSCTLALALMLFLVGLGTGLWRPARAQSADSCAQEKSCFARCQCVQKDCRLGCFEKFKDAEGKVDPKKWEPCVDACVAGYKSCVQKC